MNSITKRCWPIFLLVLIAILPSACGKSHEESHHHMESVVEKGEHNGRLLEDKNFTLELAIFETGVPPEYRAWAYLDGNSVNPSEVQLQIRLTRLGGEVDQIGFASQGNFLRGDTVIYEPHSFIVNIEANHKGAIYQWSYESFEGRTHIEPAVADALEIKTETAGPATLEETIEVFGKIAADPSREREINARYEGMITAVQVSLGQTVTAGQTLLTVESNESLRSYDIKAPIAGVVTRLDAKVGQQTRDTTLMKIIDNSRTTAELAIFPAQLARIKTGAEVTVIHQEQEFTGAVAQLALETNANQSVTARVPLEQSLPLGAQVTARIKVDEYSVPLAVKRAGLQTFRDFTVVYAKVGDQYEVRMLELGREAGEWVEVLGGIEPGTEYVTDNSFVIKADIEKSGASHDH
jgi:cobalt-zinc-cadmium efflux system membrane fusion protein